VTGHAARVARPKVIAQRGLVHGAGSHSKSGRSGGYGAAPQSRVARPFAGTGAPPDADGSGAWLKVRRREITAEQAAAMVDGLPDIVDELVPSVQLASRALEIAMTVSHPAYD